ncbi:NrdH-redoxin [Tamilnaduibacter salinus]|uniref:NrdH-redoxin n=1 Tax=Tamilnaduibacter salinus TaxID=1484056 RepID=A0A2A2I0M2_9GAMM|nr:glutaredoxin domain-containing protein [Tamilnaduibacter salinus]PAV25197.1 NrdH-redoxin [Tamilnaduibacter salinus]
MALLGMLACSPQAVEANDQSSNAKSSRVVLFSQPFCPGCMAAKTYFRDHHIAYLEFDITASQRARRTFERLGGKGTPFLVIGGQRINGFSRPIVRQRLKALGIAVNKME